MSAPRVEIDYTAVNYIRGNKSHQDFILQEINQFNNNFNELCNYDKRTGWLGGLLGVAWFFNSISMMGSVMINTSYAILSHEYFGRPDYARHYQDQLNKLLDLYNWCISTSGDKNITTDKTFLALAGTIASFVEYQDLKSSFTDFNNVSQEFCQLLLLHPLHKDKFIKDRESVSSGFFGFFTTSKKNDDELIKANKENAHTWGETYNHVYAKIRFDFYSRQTSQPKTLLERCREVGEPLLLKFRG